MANPVALRHLREMKPGDRLVIYETGDAQERGGDGVGSFGGCVRSKNPQVKIKVGKAIGETGNAR